LLSNYGPVNALFYKYHKDDPRGGLSHVQLDEDISQKAIDE